MTAQDRFDKALMALSETDPCREAGYEYDVDEVADSLRVARDGDSYSWVELPEHVRDYWREEASR